MQLSKDGNCSVTISSFINTQFIWYSFVQITSLYSWMSAIAAVERAADAPLDIGMLTQLLFRSRCIGQTA